MNALSSNHNQGWIGLRIRSLDNPTAGSVTAEMAYPAVALFWRQPPPMQHHRVLPVAPAMPLGGDSALGRLQQIPDHDFKEMMPLVLTELQRLVGASTREVQQVRE